MTVDAETKVRENQLRRRADRQGFVLTKSHSRDQRALDYGLFCLTDVRTKKPVKPPTAGRWKHTMTLKEVEAYLNRRVDK